MFKQRAADPLPTWLLKEAIIILAPYFTTIFNSSITEGHFPRTWRHAIVTPLLKKAGWTSLLHQAIVRFQILHSFRKSSKGLSTAKLSLTSMSLTCFQMLSRHTDDVIQRKPQYGKYLKYFQISLMRSSMTRLRCYHYMI